MASAATRTVGKAAAKRLSGSGAGPLQAFAAAAVVGVATAVLTYRLLRSGN
jgi:hypothetical protein